MKKISYNGIDARGQRELIQATESYNSRLKSRSFKHKPMTINLNHNENINQFQREFADFLDYDFEDMVDSMYFRPSSSPNYYGNSGNGWKKPRNDMFYTDYTPLVNMQEV